MGLKATLTYRFDDGEHPDLEAVRVTVGTGSMRVIGTHSRLVRLAGEIAEAENKAERDDEQATAAAGALVAAVEAAEGMATRRICRVSRRRWRRRSGRRIPCA